MYLVCMKVDYVQCQGEPVQCDRNGSGLALTYLRIYLCKGVSQLLGSEYLFVAPTSIGQILSKQRGPVKLMLSAEALPV